jgi:transposase
MLDLSGHVAELQRLTRTDPDPRVCHRADALLVLAHGRRVDEAAHDIDCRTRRIRVWRRQFLREGRQGLADRARQGRPPKLDDQTWTELETALAASPLDSGYPVTTWAVADLADPLGQRG